MIHESQVGDQGTFRLAAENGDTVLTWTGGIEPKRLEPPPIEAALIQAADQNTQDIKDVTGIHDASLGAQSNETSGKAILARSAKAMSPPTSTTTTCTPRSARAGAWSTS
jgi:hypothetical protein